MIPDSRETFSTAETMWVREGKTLTDIAKSLGKNRATLSRWRKAGNWDAKRSEYLQNCPQAVLDVLRRQRERMILDREKSATPDGQAAAVDPAYADSIYKITAVIEKLEAKSEAVGPVLDAMDRFVRWCRLELTESKFPIIAEAIEAFLTALRRGEV